MRETAIIIAITGILVFAAHLFEAVFRRTRIPDVLLLIIIGLCLGPFFHVVSVSDFGELGTAFTIITFIVILFEAGLRLDINALLVTFRRTALLAILVFFLTMAAASTVALLFFDIGIAQSLTLGAIVGCTSPAVVAPIIRQLNMKADTQIILLIESTLTDVLSIVITIALIEATLLGKFDIGIMTGTLISSFVMATLLGIICAFIWSIILNRIRNLQNSIFTTVAFIFIVYGIAELMGYGGAITALTFGIVFGNIELFRHPLVKLFRHDIFSKPVSPTENEKGFFSELVFLLKTFFFVYVGISIQITSWWVVWAALILTFVILLIRFPVVKFTMPKSIRIPDVSIMAVMIPKGLATAVLASIPLQQGIENGYLIQNIVYVIILASIILTSVLIPIVERTKSSKLFRFIFSGFSADDS